MAKPKKTKKRYFEVQPLIDKYPKARYYYILGGRGCGKTYPVIQKAIKDAIDGKGVFAYIRRYKESLKTRNLEMLISPHDKFVEEYTDGVWNKIKYWRGCFYLERWEPNDNGVMERVDKNPVPIGGAWSMNTWESDKGPDFGADKGGVAHIIVDEVLSKAGQYLSDEWSIVQNVISSLVRDRWEQDTKIWMLANPISKWNNPYFRNMGFNKKLIEEPGTTEVQYKGENDEITMTAVFCYIAAITDKYGNVKEIDENRTNVYNNFFAFSHSKGKSKSITHGFWEMEDSARLPSGTYDNSTKNRTIYLIFEEEKLAIDVMRYDVSGVYYMFVYPTQRIRDKTYYITLNTSLDKYAIIGDTTNHPIWQLFKQIYLSGQVYYSDDTTADAFHGFLLEARKRQV